MQLKGTTIRNAILALILFIGGSFVQYRYQVVERVLLRSPLQGVLPANSQIGKVENTEVPAAQGVDFSQFWEVWRLLERDYLEPENITAEDMVNGAIAGMTASIGDPYTMYLPPEDNKRSAEDLAGSFYGVGIELGYIDNTLAVMAPLKGTPADNANVEAGDLILHVTDEAKGVDDDTTNWSLTKAVENIRGPKGSSVTLTLYRESQGGQPFDVTLERGEIVVESVELTFEEHAGKRVAHVVLSRFGERTNAEWDQVVGQILADRANVDAVVLDMRNNPGGFFDDAIYIASDFVPKGTIVTQKGKYESQDFTARGRARLTGMPVSVLVNRGSASASEIVAGALRDQLDIPLVGERTFGKGTVQDRRELSNGGGLHVTVARWLLPDGDWIHDEGIAVDVEVTDDPETEADEMLLKAIESA